MATGNPYSRMINTMREEGAYNNGYNMELATIISVCPLKIKYNDVIISSGIYCNKMFLMKEDLKAALADEVYIGDDVKDILNKVYEYFKFAVNDIVIVQRVDNNFYICGKVVKA